MPSIACIAWLLGDQDNQKADHHLKRLHIIGSCKERTPAPPREARNRTPSMACVAWPLSEQDNQTATHHFKRLHIIGCRKEQAPAHQEKPEIEGLRLYV